MKFYITMYCVYIMIIVASLKLCTVQLKCNVAIARESQVRVDDVSSPLTFV